MTSREEQKVQSMYLIGEVALDLFYDRGFNNTKISDIAAKAGVSVGLISYYFGSKEKLFESIINMSQNTLQTVNDLLVQTGDPLEVIKQGCEALFKRIGEDKRAAKIFLLIYDVNSNPQADRQIRQLIPRIDFFERTAELIQEGQKVGDIREGNPKFLAKLFWTSIFLVIGGVVTGESDDIPPISWFIHILSV
ncbi:TetR/AcrR family transcriptional regulator [Vagococcus sp. BWB3-3]|uniref:TetR/AcrR family transcriptional regulator n=1 Tax=Vagococcus allomyrinae TaxID=2794353 RepID=A0A940PAP5_9ENTE|nr:TetR/AcrR family transcriptional regulator [Vagococcus allomyrinae]MBP1041072.1 TetR/AcrR family transcriptional regulator [Vagococcus allomyrinae]